MELAKIYFEQQKKPKMRTAKIPSRCIEKPEVDLGELVQLLKLEMDLLLRQQR